MRKGQSSTSRERVLAALNHQEGDRVPIDLGGFQSGIHVRAYQTLLDHMGWNEDISLLDPVQQLAVPSERVLRFLHADVRYVTARPPASFDGSVRQTIREGGVWHDLKDEFGVVWSMPEQGLYMDISRHPLAEATIRDLDKYPFPKGDDPSRFAGLRDHAEAVKRKTGCALASGICGVTYESCWYMRGMERWFIDMVENPAFCAELLDRTSGFWTDWMNGFLREVGDLLDVVMIGDDLAGQEGPLFAPSFYRSVVKPRQRAVVEAIKKGTKAKVWYHTCGSCVDFVPDLLDNGIDILNPVQIGARNMDPAMLKKRFGKHLVFWGGGIDAQHILPFASPERVRTEVRRNVSTLMPGGGYVFANVHNIQAGTPPENILAFYDEAYRSGLF